MAPSIYRNLAMYLQLHVYERDFYGNVVTWQNLELLNSNLLVHAVRVLKTDVLKDLPSVTYSPMFYELDKAHAKAYERLCAEHILKFRMGKS